MAEIYADGPEADWADNPHSYRIDEFIVSPETVLQIRLAARGGQAIRFRPASDADLSSLAEYQIR